MGQEGKRRSWVLYSDLGSGREADATHSHTPLTHGHSHACECPYTLIHTLRLTHAHTHVTPFLGQV